MDIDTLIDVVGSARNAVTLRMQEGEAQVRVSESAARQYVGFKNDALRILPEEYRASLPFYGKSADTIESIQNENITYGDLFQAYSTMSTLLTRCRDSMPVQ